MKVILLIIFLSFVNIIPHQIFATSDQAYTDYLYQFDQYRTSLNDFKVAKEEYLKFKTLIAQTKALEKTKTMLTTRDSVIRAYLLFLYEKLNEATSLPPSTRQLYQTLLQSEVKFLDAHLKLIPDIGSLEDANNVSIQFTAHYGVLQSTIHQTIVTITLGELAFVDKNFGTVFTNIQTLIQTSRSNYSPEKQSTMDRWLLQIQNKRSLYQQKADQIQSDSSGLKSLSLSGLADKFLVIQKNLLEAKQYQIEAVSYLTELKDLMKYIQ